MPLQKVDVQSSKTEPWVLDHAGHTLSSVVPMSFTYPDLLLQEKFDIRQRLVHFNNPKR